MPAYSNSHVGSVYIFGVLLKLNIFLSQDLNIASDGCLKSLSLPCLV